MKNIFKYTFAAVLGTMALVACTNEYEYDGVGEPDKATAAGAYFLEEGNPKSIEVEPGAEEFDLTLTRSKTESAQSVSIVVVSDEAGVFDVPATAEFAAGESTSVLHITAPRAQEGAEYSLTIGIAENGRLKKSTRETNTRQGCLKKAAIAGAQKKSRRYRTLLTNILSQKTEL